MEMLLGDDEEDYRLEREHIWARKPTIRDKR